MTYGGCLGSPFLFLTTTRSIFAAHRVMIFGDSSTSRSPSVFPPSLSLNSSCSPINSFCSSGPISPRVAAASSIDDKVYTPRTIGGRAQGSRQRSVQRWWRSTVVICRHSWCSLMWFRFLPLFIYIRCTSIYAVGECVKWGPIRVAEMMQCGVNTTPIPYTLPRLLCAICGGLLF